MARFRKPLVFLFACLSLLSGCDRSTDPGRENLPPAIASASTAYASGGIAFSYRVVANDPDNSNLTIIFTYVPAWAAVEADSVYGLPTHNSKDDSIKVVVSDGQLADSAVVQVRMVPPLVVYGDSRTGHDAHRRVVAQILNVYPTVVFHSGDLVGTGTLPSDWDTFNEITAEMRNRAEFFPALGNHELQAQLYFDNFELPGNEQWYSVVRNRAHFIILNSCVDISPGSVQYQWLVDDLSSIADSIWFTAVVFHHPPYSTGAHAEDELDLRNILVPLFEEYGVDIVFNGHDHDYERSYCGDIYYIVTGGGGAPLRGQARDHPCSQLFLQQYHFCKVSVLPERIFISVINDLGEVIDEFTLPVQPRYRHRSGPSAQHGANRQPMHH
ncbi:MAG: metallophosphoesterase [Candidatus Zixiibacteriota bacterium]|nr:MAG: metallophosphoesterase [candidate division Zixibacteria bacterium]